MQISSLIGKPVLSPSGTAYGYVTDVRLAKNYRKISCLVCADGEEEEFYLPVRTVLSVSDAVIAGKARLTSPTGISSPIGRPAYTFEGKALGTVSDVLVEEDNEGMLVIGGELRTTVPASCASVKETVIIYPDATKRNEATKHSDDARKTIKRASEPAQKPQDAVPAPAPQTQFIGRTNLLGRHVRRSVYDAGGTPIAIAGEKITPAILQSARRAGKLLELTVNTLTAYY